jgi:glutamate-1-semialdehyde 2,1-aminomutase
MLTVFLPDEAAFAAFHRRLRQGGVLIAPSQFEAWFVSTAHTDEDVQRTLDAAR